MVTTTLEKQGEKKRELDRDGLVSQRRRECKVRASYSGQRRREGSTSERLDERTAGIGTKTKAKRRGKKEK